MNQDKLELDIAITTDIAAVDALAEATLLSKQKLKQAMSKGAVWLSLAGSKPKRLRRSKRMLQPGDQLSLYYDSGLLSSEPPNAILIQDQKDYSVWVKPYGMLSQGSKWADHFTIHRWVEQNAQPQRKTMLVHRLDRAASGLILLAHNSKAAHKLSELFRQHKIEKQYQVIVHGEFPLSIWPEIVEQPLDDKPAKSSFKRIAFDASSQTSLLNVAIETGRKHQIRRHLQLLGYPVVGDRLYGSENSSKNLQLVACSLSFLCPITHQKMNFQLPKELMLAL